MKELDQGRTVHCLRNGKAAREFTVSHEQTETNPAQPRERLTEKSGSDLNSESIREQAI
jgi:hypothetical protein